MKRKYFGTDGIRGLSNGKLTADLALKVGQAAGIAFRKKVSNNRVIIGKDTRLSGYMIENALVAGLTSVGMDVLLLGPMPTPAVAMLTRAMRADVGVMISASHNPYQDNGIKLFGPDGYKLDDEKEMEIDRLIDNLSADLLALPVNIGHAKRIESGRARYVEFAKRTLKRDISFEGLRVVIDCANGAGYKVAPETLWELGAEVIAIGAEPNGVNINRDVGSTAPQALIDKVLERRADIGIALDGDADRVLIVDERGNVIDGDQILALLARRLQATDELNGEGIVATVMSNGGLDRHLAGYDIAVSRTTVGDRYVIERMREGGFNLGGEQSGHIILSDHVSTGDGLVAAIQVLAAVQQTGRRTSEVCRQFDPFPQVLKNVRLPSGVSAKSFDLGRIQTKCEARLGDGGRLLIRPSGTEPVIRVMAEGEDAVVVSTVVDEICSELGDAHQFGLAA